MPGSRLCLDDSRASVHGDALAIAQTHCRITDTNDGWNAILSGHQGRMGRQRSTVGHDCHCKAKKRCPCGRGPLGYQHLTRLEAREVLWTAHDSHWPCGAARACGHAT